MLSGGDTVSVQVGSLDPNVSLQVSEGDPDAVEVGGSSLGSSVVSIVLSTSNGASIQPTAPILICFDSSKNGTNKNSEGTCLGSFDESKRKWVCDDPCLTVANGTLCGTVDHLTNFALLLGGSGKRKNGDPCASESSPGFILSYISAALVGTAICIVLFSIVLVEIRIQYYRRASVRNKVVIEITE